MTPPHTKHTDERRLSKHLQNALSGLFEHWYNPKVGLVAAALVDGDKVAYSMSSYNEEGKRKHAERQAVESFKTQYGKPSPDAVMVVSLGPCYKEHDTRAGEACSTLLKQEGIRKLYIGAMDATQDRTVKAYEEMGFEVQVCKKPVLATCCYMLAKMFPRYEEARQQGTPMSEIKLKLKNSPLCPRRFFENNIKPHLYATRV